MPRRLIPLILALFAFAAPAHADQEQIIQLILNITKGSPSTPGHVGYLALAERNLQAAREAADAASRTDDPASIKRHLNAVVLALDPPPDFTGSDQAGLVRAVVGIAGNAAVAAQMPGASSNVRTQAARIDASAGNIIDWSAQAVDQITPALEKNDMAALKSTTASVQMLLTRMRDGDGGLAQIKQDVAQLAGGEGLSNAPGAPGSGD